MRVFQILTSVAACAVLLVSCASEGSSGGGGEESTGGETGAETGEATGSGETTGVDDDATGSTEPVRVGDYDPENPNPLCGYIADNEGGEVGDHIKDFGLKTYLGENYWLHQNCGNGNTKAVWIILATGW
jgi:hypothetical protein